MKTTLTIGLCLCLLTLGPGGGHGGGPAIVKPNSCLNTSSDVSTSCTSSSSSDKNGFTSEESLTDSEALENGGYRSGEDKRDQWTRSARIPSHQFMRFGRDHQFLRFGRATQHQFMRFGRGGAGMSDTEPQLSHKFFRFGRGGVSDNDEYGSRSGDEDGYQRLAKSDNFGHQFLRFGKKSQENDGADLDFENEPEYADQPETGDDDVSDEDMSRTTKSEHKFFRFGRGPSARGHSFMRFGRNPSAPTHKFMRFGRIPEHMFFRFGRAGSYLSSMAPKNPTSTTPIVKSIVTGTTTGIDSRNHNDDDDLPTKARLTTMLQDEGTSVGDHSNNNMADTGMKLKREGHLFMRFGRK